VEGDAGWLDVPTPPKFVATTGLTERQLTAELFASIAYMFGSVEGRFVGFIVNDTMPLCDGDFWGESTEPGIRTWHPTGGGFRFYPYTLGDVRLVTHAGASHCWIGESERHLLSMSPGRDSFSVRGLTDADFDSIFRLLRSFGIEVLVDQEVLRQFVNDDGDIRY
jgi:hypothetical protein